MEQKMESEEFYCKKCRWSFVMVLVIFGMIQFDAVASMIPNQIVGMAVSNYLYAGLKPLFIREFFTGYPLYTIRNLVYYPLEVLLMLELLIYSQKAGETLTKKISFPWGAIVLYLL